MFTSHVHNHMHLNIRKRKEDVVVVDETEVVGTKVKDIYHSTYIRDSAKQFLVM